MSAADVTPEEIAELRTMPHDNHRLVRRLLDAIEAAWAREKALEDQLAARHAPVAVEVPELFPMDGHDDRLNEVMVYGDDPIRSVVEWGTINRMVAWFLERIRIIPPSRILKDGEVAVRVEILSAMEGCIAALRADAELIPSKALDYLDAIRSKGGES